MGLAVEQSGRRWPRPKKCAKKHPIMSQLPLFDRDRIVREEVRHFLMRLDFARAAERVRAYRAIRGVRPLTWELKVLRFDKSVRRRNFDLDAGFEFWERFELSTLFPKIPEAYSGAMRANFFSRLVALNRSLFEDARTAGGRSLGDYYMYAEQPRNARRSYERERLQYGENWDVRLKLGNCNFVAGDVKAARSNYRQSFLLGLPPDGVPDIVDTELRRDLTTAEDPDWAFPEAFAEGRFPSPRFTIRAEFEEFVRTFVDPLSGEAASEIAPPRQFGIHWVVSENRHFCDDVQLLRSRWAMKALHPRLHTIYMHNLEWRPG